MYMTDFLLFRSLETNPDAVVILVHFAGYLRIVGAVRMGVLHLSIAVKLSEPAQSSRNIRALCGELTAPTPSAA